MVAPCPVPPCSHRVHAVSTTLGKTTSQAKTTGCPLVYSLFAIVVLALNVSVKVNPLSTVILGSPSVVAISNSVFTSSKA